jgi:hypothetical protein
MTDSKKEYYLKNRAKILAKAKKYNKTNKEKIKIYKQNYHLENRVELNNISLKYRNAHKEELQDYFKNYQAENKEEISKYQHSYYEENKVELNSYHNEYLKIKRQEDPIFALRSDISKTINYYLKKNSSSKKGNSILEYLPYSIQELKDYLENLFEPWMNWENRGAYHSSEWDDNDQTTWMWQIDHIIPQSDLLYMSMKDDNFKKCWSLENLRPYSAKQNMLDGSTKIRHGAIK